MPHKSDQELLLEPNMRRTLHAILKLASIGEMLTFLPCNFYALRRKKRYNIPSCGYSRMTAPAARPQNNYVS